MNKYVKGNGRHLLFALLLILVSTVAAVTLQFFKGNVLDSAISGNAGAVVRYSIILISSILLELGFFYFYRQQSSKFTVNCTRSLKEDIFSSILRCSYPEYKNRSRGEYIARYTSEADLIRDRYFGMLPTLFEILLKVLFVSVSLFLLDCRIAVITLFLLTTPLYIPKLIQKRLCLARALLRDTQVLILDEPLANLDGDTARRIERLLFAVEEKTIVVISHQFSGEYREKFDVVKSML